MTVLLVVMEGPVAGAHETKARVADIFDPVMIRDVYHHPP
jgi:hypothetical protein